MWIMLKTWLKGQKNPTNLIKVKKLTYYVVDNLSALGGRLILNNVEKLLHAAIKIHILVLIIYKILEGK